MKRILPVFLIGTALALVTSGLRAENGGKQPNFIVILGEGAGGNSTSVPMDVANPEPGADRERRNAVREW